MGVAEEVRSADCPKLELIKTPAVRMTKNLVFTKPHQRLQTAQVKLSFSQVKCASAPPPGKPPSLRHLSNFKKPAVLESRHSSTKQTLHALWAMQAKSSEDRFS